MLDADPLYDTPTLRGLEQRANAASGDATILMQRAGSAAWRELLRRWPAAQSILVVCGTGNNGGDGYVMATQALVAGRTVSIVRMAPPNREPAIHACNGFETAGGQCSVFDGDLPNADILVDGLFGIGLERAPDAASTALIDAINACGCPVLALDVPSGIDADRGDAPGAAVRADCTLQFLGAHAGLATGAALDHRGALAVDPLGVDLTNVEPTAHALGARALRNWLRPRCSNSHKGDNGHVLCIGGDAGSGGAIALCADAALRCGAGLVSVATRAAHVVALLARRPEAMVAAVETIDALTPQLARASVVCVGPGLGTGGWGERLLAAALACGKPLVIDADALNMLATQPGALHPDTILTPHPGEAGRLLGVGADVVQSDRYAASARLVERFGCVVVLKGAGTIVRAPGRRPRVIAAGNPGMAVGGMGDLLTGVIAALRAQGLDAFDAAACGALLHAVAGDAAAADGGERGLLPSDLLPHLRRLSNPDTPQ